jgi:hypothetical protein
VYIEIYSSFGSTGSAYIIIKREKKMKRLIQLFIGIIVLANIVVLPLAQAADMDAMGNAKKAKAMFDKAIALIEREGLIRALYEFNTRKEYVDGDIHMMVVSEDGVVFAYSLDPGLIGVNYTTVKSENRETGEIYSFQDALADMEKAGDDATEIAWKWMNPVKNEVEQKRAYTKRVHDTKSDLRVTFYVGAAYFVPLDK